MRSSGSREDTAQKPNKSGQILGRRWKIFFVIFPKLIPRRIFLCIAKILVLMVGQNDTDQTHPNYGEKKPIKKNHIKEFGGWMPRRYPRDKLGTSQGQTRDVPGTPGTFGPDLCVVNTKGTECPRDRRDISRDRWDVSPGQTGHITGQMGRVPGTDGSHTRGCPAKILYVYWFFLSPQMCSVTSGKYQPYRSKHARICTPSPGMTSLDPLQTGCANSVVGLELAERHPGQHHLETDGLDSKASVNKKTATQKPQLHLGFPC